YLIRQDVGDDIISKRSLRAVKEVISLLKRHATEEGLFRRAGRRRLRRQIFNSLKRGEILDLENIEDSALECAAALQLFLIRLKRPLIPRDVQQLILADNPGVAVHVVAMDALGLIRQDVRGRHGELLADLLDLLRHLTLSGPPAERSELQGSPLPIALLPVFFSLTPADLIKWKQVAARFNELITVASENLQANNERFGNAEHRNIVAPIINSLEQLARLSRLPLLYPLIRLTNDHNAYILQDFHFHKDELDELTQALAVPVRRVPPDSLRYVISHSST
ncbi:uncharacterized protein, partial [Prorops nasuta]|uniref:uncharacterized protein n=1 Tax=Prorops nasuta TaxID=863751 RepID=UPI0034CFBF73